MKIRLLIPQCDNWHGAWYCNDSIIHIDNGNIREYDHIRIHTLNASMQKDFDLLVTSNNFFKFYLSVNQFNIVDFINNILIPWLNMKIENKIPLIIGFDIATPGKKENKSKKTKKGKKSKETSEEEFNPYGGIDAVVAYFDVRRNSYVYRTHIWECWSDINEYGQPDYKCFRNQEDLRYIDDFAKGNRIGLLSCGDIARYCHGNGNFLEKAKKYINLSHCSLRGHCSQLKVPPLMINNWRKCEYVFVTQQVRYDSILRYLNQNYYSYVFPNQNQNAFPSRNPINHNVLALLVGGTRMGALVDITI